MGKRHDAIGIKQVVRLEWYDIALDMLISGYSPAQIRAALDEYISERLQSGGYGERGEQTYTKAVAQIMRTWVLPANELIEFRDAALDYAKKAPREIRILLHWAITSAGYPFWFRVAYQVGRLFNLQNVVTQTQIRLRCFESMGERTTVERSARRAIRSFAVWGVLKDSKTKGCYEKESPVVITDHNLAILMLESALHAIPEGKATLGLLSNNPAFFPFLFPVISGDYISQRSERIEVVRYGLDEEMLKLK